jgi:hypothetical protein
MSDPLRTERGVRPGPGWLPEPLFREPFWLALLALIVTVFGLLFIRFTFLVGVDHDEVEHAHVAYRILSGELPYRDFYQNHWPTYWLVVTRFVQSFPFSMQAILASRVVGLVALTGCCLLGLRLLLQIPGGRTREAWLVYTAAVIILGVVFEFYVARPDPLMALFATAGLCLIPACGAVRSPQALGLGILFGLAISVSSKVIPMTLVVPLLITFQAVVIRSLRPLVALAAYAAGIVLALLPTAWWLNQHELFAAFYFDVFALNMAVHKPWYRSFELLKVVLLFPSLLGVFAWLWTRWGSAARTDNGLLVVILSLLCGVLLAFIIRHAGIYNMQVLIIPLAVGFTSLASYLSLHASDLGKRVLILAALLGYPVSYTAIQLALFRNNSGMAQSEVQEIMDLARPGNRTCIGFAPTHPVFCNSVSQLSITWDLWFAQNITDPRQSERLQRIWHEAIERTVTTGPDIIVRRTPDNVWEQAVEHGLIGQNELDALDRVKPDYEVRMIGEQEIWVKRPHP